MKKQYTKKQIQEAIAYWERQLRRMDEAGSGDGKPFADVRFEVASECEGGDEIDGQGSELKKFRTWDGMWDYLREFVEYCCHDDEDDVQGMYYEMEDEALDFAFGLPRPGERKKILEFQYENGGEEDDWLRQSFEVYAVRI